MEQQIFTEDLEIAQALIRKDERVTRNYLYGHCAPLFKSIYSRFHTGCASCEEFISEIYLVIMTPSKKTGRCQLENFKGESTLTNWLKTACLFYCYGRYGKDKRIEIVDLPDKKSDKNGVATDRLIEIGGSIDFDFSSMDRTDLEKIISMMPNKRYSELIRLRYVKNYSNEETAKILGMSMDNYYNKHLAAKKQYTDILKKEEARHE